MNPYIAHPDHIPKDDRYADLPLYGRIVTILGGSTWALYGIKPDLPRDPNEGRDVFAVGSLIVKSSHRHESAKVDYTYADANEVQAINIAKRVFRGIRVPDIYFSGKVCLSELLDDAVRLTLHQINGRPVLVQERLPGVSLEVAWPYLSEDQKASFKIQARMMLRQMHAIKAPSSRRMQDHIVPDPSILTNGRLNPQEAQILFSANLDQDLGFMHNDLTPSNCIVDDDKIVGLIDWEMAGYLGWKTAGEIHRRIRCPQREHFVCANVSEERLQGIMWWNDIYDGEMP